MDVKGRAASWGPAQSQCFSCLSRSACAEMKATAEKSNQFFYCQPQNITGRVYRTINKRFLRRFRSGRKTHQGINRTWNGPTLDGELSTASAFSLWPVIMVHRWFHFTLLCLSFSSSSFVILKLFLLVLGMRKNKVSLSLSLCSTTTFMLFCVEVLLVFH